MRNYRWILEKWNFWFGILPDYSKRNGYIFIMGIFKLISFPDEGAVFQKENYKGFWIRRCFSYNGFEIIFKI